MRTTHVRAATSGAVVVLALLAACGDPFGLPDPNEANVVDTVSLWAWSGTPLERPSAYVLSTTGAAAVRTDVNSDFGVTLDFAFDIDTAGRAWLYPTAAVDLGVGSGVLLSSEPFDSIKVAPTGEYEDSVAVEVAPGDVAVIRSRPLQCLFPGITYFLYAKLRVLTVDLVDRRVDFEILADINCGYRGLEPGFPDR